MANNESRHIGDDQLVYGLPKRMHAQANAQGTASSPAELKTYWHYVPKPKACPRCQAMKGILFEEDPGPGHDNCLCRREQVVPKAEVNGHTTIIVPPGVNIEANIREAKRVAWEIEKQAAMAAYGASGGLRSVVFAHKCIYIYKNFKSGSRYDYKKLGKQYEAFGNYHYGLYTNAMGIDISFAQAAAGAYQIYSNTSKEEFRSTWYDDPDDNDAIRKGQRYPID